MLFGQKTFSVYAMSEDDNPLESTVFVKEGFSVLAFVFTFFWALYYRIWWLVAFCFIFQITKQYLAEYEVISTQTSYIISMAYAAMIGLQAQDWYGQDLERKGYTLIGIVMAGNLEEAQQRFFDKYMRHARRIGDSMSSNVGTLTADT